MAGVVVDYSFAQAYPPLVFAHEGTLVETNLHRRRRNMRQQAALAFVVILW